VSRGFGSDTLTILVVFPDYVSPTNEPIYLSGFFALDYTVGGLKIELGGEECEWILHPSNLDFDTF
jgi:hypothetical protein